MPVAVFYTRDLRYLYHYIEMPKIYRKERVVAAMQAPRPGETKEQTWDRFMADWRALQLSPFYPLWAPPSTRCSRPSTNDS
jgi:hypothetical protein